MTTTQTITTHPNKPAGLTWETSSNTITLTLTGVTPPDDDPFTKPVLVPISHTIPAAPPAGSSLEEHLTEAFHQLTNQWNSWRETQIDLVERSLSRHLSRLERSIEKAGDETLWGYDADIHDTPDEALAQWIERHDDITHTPDVQPYGGFLYDDGTLTAWTHKPGLCNPETGIVFPEYEGDHLEKTDQLDISWVTVDEEDVRKEARSFCKEGEHAQVIKHGSGLIVQFAYQAETSNRSLDWSPGRDFGWEDQNGNTDGYSYVGEPTLVPERVTYGWLYEQYSQFVRTYTADLEALKAELKEMLYDAGVKGRAAFLAALAEAKAEPSLWRDHYYESPEAYAANEVGITDAGLDLIPGYGQPELSMDGFDNTVLLAWTWHPLGEGNIVEVTIDLYS